MKKLLCVLQMFLIPVLWLTVFFRHLFDDAYTLVYNRYESANWEVKSAVSATIRDYWK